MGQVWLASALWMGLALAASILSVWTRVSVALIEVFIGVLAGNLIGLSAAPWVDYLAGLGAIMLAFLAGTEIQWVVARAHLRTSLAIGSAAFIAPFLAVLFFTNVVLDWTWLQAVTFGTITAFFGLTHGIIDHRQYAILVTAVIASGTVPILIARRMLHRPCPAVSQPEGGSNAE